LLEKLQRAAASFNLSAVVVRQPRADVGEAAKFGTEFWAFGVLGRARRRSAAYVYLGPSELEDNSEIRFCTISGTQLVDQIGFHVSRRYAGII
jgi:hypothetical protein